MIFVPSGIHLSPSLHSGKQIWDIATKRIRSVFPGHSQEIYSLDFSRDGRRIVSGSGDRTARIWDMDTGTAIVLAVDADGADAATGDAGVTSVAISPDGRYVAAGSLDTVVRIWDANSGALVERLRGHRDSVYSVVFTPDGRGVVSGSLDKTLKYWDVSGLATAKPKKEASAGGKDAPPAEKLGQCTMNFTGHKVCAAAWGLHHDCLTKYDLGLCAVGRCLARRAVDCLWLQGPRCTVLGPCRGRPVYATGAQELR